MKHFIFSLSLLIPLLFTTQGGAQHYHSETGVTVYPNNTLYIPSNSKSNPTNDNIVKKTTFFRNSDGGRGSTQTTINCTEHPKACKQALEEAADDAERRDNGTQNIKDGCGTLDDWLSRPGDWPNSPPIFFPDGRMPGIPLPPQRIAAHTERIIRQIR